ncbi:uncharacterized protein LOC135837736 [Planococcus citri]|uniref:uncharacterized protein LOC135837736 n=1 Tax=Planococcus citri TaxID=170843 RepID=UPI0031F72BFF
MPILERCCCGCPLGGGSQIIVTLNLIGAIIYLLYGFADAGSEDVHHNIKESPGFFGVILHLFLPTIGLIAVYKKKPVLLLVYVIILWIGIAIVTLFTFIIWIAVASEYDDIPALYLILIFFLFAYCGVQAYLSLVLFSYYQELQHPSRSQGTATVV